MSDQTIPGWVQEISESEEEYENCTECKEEVTINLGVSFHTVRAADSIKRTADGKISSAPTAHFQTYTL